MTRRPDAGGFAPADGARVELEPLAPAVIERLVIAATEASGGSDLATVKATAEELSP